MKNISDSLQVLILITVFVLSRIVATLMGLHMNIWALYAYWQYLDLDTLQHHLIRGVWFDHAQPPVFNLFLGAILKIGGANSTILFSILLKGITLANSLILFSILKKLTVVPYIPLLAALAYTLSPATLVFEYELFYTTTVSLLLLISVYFLIRFTTSGRWWNVIGTFFPLSLLCLTRSVYHITWLIGISALLILYFRKNPAKNKLILVSLAAVVLTGSWYLKNKLLFDKFTASTWIGMNMARNVFHDNVISDSSRIEAYEPFSRISVYRKFLDSGFENRFKGMNDRDLLQEMKNDSFINETEVSYIPVSELYMKASMDYIHTHPGAYAKNVIQSFVLYFTPATVYSLALEPAKKIKAWDLIYSFNTTQFAKNKQQRRILLTISSVPKMILYFFVFFIMTRYCLQSRSITPWNLFIMLTIGFVFGVSSLFEHYENMRFRFETEPLFLILAAQVASRLYSRYLIRRKPPLRELIA